MKRPAYTFKDMKFPDCATNCSAVSYLGVGECESVCPWKFNKDGDPLTEIIKGGNNDN